MFPMRCSKALPPCSLRPKNTPKAYSHIVLKILFTSPLSRPRQMVDIQCDIAIMGGREVSRPYRVWFFAEGECFLCFCFCAPGIYPLNHKKSSNKHFVRCGDKKNCAAIHIVAQLLFNFHLGVKYILSLVYSLL